MTDQQSEGWPDIHPRLLTELERWARSRGFTSYTPGMTGEQALGSLAEIAGIGLVIEKLRKECEKQQATRKVRSIPSHVERSGDAATSPRPRDPGRWRSGDLSRKRGEDRAS